MLEKIVITTQLHTRHENIDLRDGLKTVTNRNKSILDAELQRSLQFVQSFISLQIVIFSYCYFFLCVTLNVA